MEIGNNSTNTSCYSTPLSSPPKLNIPPLVGLNSSVAEFSADPGFAERAAKFSCFGSRSFNGRTTTTATTTTSQNGMNNNAELAQRSMQNGKLSRVSSSPSLKALGSQVENKNSPPLHSHEESTISEQNPNGEPGVKPSPDMNSRKRKASSKAKSKETSTPSNPPKVN